MENIADESTTQYKIEHQDENGGEEKSCIWLTGARIPLKVESETPKGHFKMHLDDLRRRPQAASLFELPAPRRKSDVEPSYAP